MGLLNISAIGLAWLPVGELNLLAYADVDARWGQRLPPLHARAHGARRRDLVAALKLFTSSR